MKINKLKKYKPKFMKLQLIKTKIYDQKKSARIEDIEYAIKKVLKLIFNYHLYNKKITFVGIPKKIKNVSFKYLLKKSHHALIPESMWINGILTNQISNFKHLFKTKNETKLFKIFFQLKKKPDLVLILNNSQCQIALKEIYNSRIPVINLGENLKSTYNVVGDFTNTEKGKKINFIISLLTTVIKKANKMKKYKIVRKTNYSGNFKKVGYYKNTKHYRKNVNKKK